MKRAAARMARRSPNAKAKTKRKVARKLVSRARKPAARKSAAPKPAARRRAVAPSRKPAPPVRVRRPSRAGAAAPLVWEPRNAHHHLARVKLGAYQLLSHDLVTWTAEWKPAVGKPQRLCFRAGRLEAEEACARHRTLLDANALLVAGDHAELAAPEITSEAVAWKYPRR